MREISDHVRPYSGYSKTHLIIQRIHNVPGLESEDQPHRICDILEATAPDGLFASHADVDENPEDEARPELIESLDVEPADVRVQLTANEPVVDRVSGVPSECEEDVVVAERGEVDEGSLGK